MTGARACSRLGALSRRAASVAGLWLIVLLGFMQSGTDQASLRGQVLFAPVISPIDSGWSLLVNLGPAVDPATLLDPIDDWVTSAFTFDPADGTFHADRAGLAVINDLDTNESGQAFWAFSPPDRLQGNVTFWQQPAGVRDLAVGLLPGFNLVPWTGSDGARVSEAVAGLPVDRAHRWDPVRQAFVIWSSALPAGLQVDFILEYGEGLWIELGGDSAMVWQQSWVFSHRSAGGTQFFAAVGGACTRWRRRSRRSGRSADRAPQRRRLRCHCPRTDRAPGQRGCLRRR